jgi:conjugal transfer pilus assembly protein TraF
MTNRILSIISLLSVTSCSADYFSDHERGWHWYERDAQPKDKKEDSHLKSSPLERLKKYQKQLETAKAEAVLNPTPENVKNYQKLQYEMLEKSHKFADVWMQNVYRNPEINYSLKFPISQRSRHIYLQEKEKKKDEKILSLSKSYGLFYFFKSDCRYCEAFAPIVKRFSEKYQWEVLAISEFGETNPHFARSVKDNGLAEAWGVSVYPSLFAVNPKTGDVIPIANGMISVEEMEERIVAITKESET